MTIAEIVSMKRLSKATQVSTDPADEENSEDEEGEKLVNLLNQLRSEGLLTPINEDDDFLKHRIDPVIRLQDVDSLQKLKEESGFLHVPAK